jgi:hypothetical protein
MTRLLGLYIDLRVLDHVIVGEGPGCSLAERGLLSFPVVDRTEQNREGAGVRRSERRVAIGEINSPEILANFANMCHVGMRR